MNNLKIEYRSRTKVDPYTNMRGRILMPVAQIAASIAEFGFVNPVLVDEDGVLIAGHGRLMAARQLGMERISSIQISHLVRRKRKALVGTDNRITAECRMDEAFETGLGHWTIWIFDLDLLGFDPSEIDLL